MKLIVANWKMSLDMAATKKLLLDIKQNINSENQIVVCPSSAYFDMVSDLLCDSPISMGAQNCFYEKQGAFTGETSVLTLGEFGCKYCIVGHSERRSIFGETNDIVSKKAALCIENNIIPIVCIGETAQENENGQTKAILTKQIKESLPQTSTSENIVIAYEPIWAIGTGKSATIEELNEIYEFLSTELPGHKLLYGGSVTPENAHNILAIKGVSGLLIGGASLDAQKFEQICKIKY